MKKVLMGLTLLTSISSFAGNHFDLGATYNALNDLETCVSKHQKLAPCEEELTAALSVSTESGVERAIQLALKEVQAIKAVDPQVVQSLIDKYDK